MSDSLIKFLKEFSETPHEPKKHVMLVGGDMHEYINAIFGGDEKEQYRISAKMKRESEERLKQEYTLLKDMLSKECYEAFVRADKEFRRILHFLDNARNSGDKYRYEWVTDIEMGEMSVHVSFEGGLFKVYAEVDYGYGGFRDVLHKDVKPEELFDKVEEVRRKK